MSPHALGVQYVSSSVLTSHPVNVQQRAAALNRRLIQGAIVKPSAVPVVFLGHRLCKVPVGSLAFEFAQVSARLGQYATGAQPKRGLLGLS